VLIGHSTYLLYELRRRGGLARFCGPSDNSSMLRQESEGVVETIREALAKRPEVLEAYLFGSRARGDARPGSDTDVAVFLDPVAVEDLAGYAAALAADLMAALRDNRVDLVVLNTAPPLLYHRVLRDGVRVLSRDLRATTTREGRALSRYCDFVPFQRKIDAAHEGRMARGEFGT
jgi:predicted nucleotidyltransferase